MKIEHLGYQVPDPIKTAAWYCEHIGFNIVRSVDNEAKTRFLADSSGTVMIEIYNNPKAMVPDYQSMDPLVLHLAFVCSDVPAKVKTLVAAGATLLEEFKTPKGDSLAMMRDPWGLAIQLCDRKTPLIRG